MKGIVDGPLMIEQDGVMSGIVTGDVIVRTGVRATIKGIVSGDVIVESGATADVTGIVSGRVIGTASVSGMVANRG